MRKERIGYDALLEEFLAQGKLPPEVEAEARQALALGSQLAQWRAAMRLLQAASDKGSLSRIDEPESGGAVRFVDLTRARIITVSPPRVPVRDYAIAVGPRIPDRASIRDRRDRIDPILTSVATSQSETELGNALDNIERFLQEVLPDHVCSITPTASPNGSDPSAAALPPSAVVRAGSELSDYVRSLVIEDGRTLYFPDLAEEPHLAAQLTDGALRSGALLPLSTGGETFGLLEAWHRAPGSLTEDDLGLLALLAVIAGGLVRNARRLEQLIFVDPLTEVYTRGYFDEEFRREIERSNRSGASLALLMIDVDHFKQVNDTHGHAAGDSALRFIARLLKAHVRQIDLVSRYGGEEFAVLLPGASEDDARRAAERLRSVVEEATIAIGGDTTVRLTLSVGAALYPAHARGHAELLDRADRVALYRAKRDGRNRVVMWGPEIEGHAGPPGRTGPP